MLGGRLASLRFGSVGALAVAAVMAMEAGCAGGEDEAARRGDPGAGGEGACTEVEVPFERATPAIVLLIDQSGSMGSPFDGTTRWDALRGAITDGQTGLVKVLQDEVRFGLALFTSINGYAGGACPRLAEIEATLGSFDAICAEYSDAQPADDAPVADSLRAVADDLAALDAPGSKVILLAMDGAPDTCADPDPDHGYGEAIMAAQHAHAQGIRTVVLGVGADVQVGFLRDMADAGEGLTVGGMEHATFYQALDQASLTGALAEIVGGVRSCVVALDGEVTGDPALGRVTLDGEPVLYGDPDGWRLDGPSELELTGEACAHMKEGERALRITFPCDAVVMGE